MWDIFQKVLTYVLEESIFTLVDLKIQYCKNFLIQSDGDT